MESARPLHEVFDELATGRHSGREPAEVLQDAGHGELPDGLVSEAIASFADTTGIEVAEHLAPFVTAAGSGVTGFAGLDGLALLATAPLAAQDLDADALAAADTTQAPDAADGLVDAAADSLDFGIGELAGDTADAVAEGHFVDEVSLDSSQNHGHFDGEVPVEPETELVDDFGEGAGAGVADGEPDFDG